MIEMEGQSDLACPERVAPSAEKIASLNRMMGAGWPLCLRSTAVAGGLPSSPASRVGPSRLHRLGGRRLPQGSSGLTDEERVAVQAQWPAIALGPTVFKQDDPRRGKSSPTRCWPDQRGNRESLRNRCCPPRAIQAIDFVSQLRPNSEMHATASNSSQ